MAVVVARDDADLDSVQAELFERVLEHHHDRLGDVAATGLGLIDPVTDGSGLERAAHDVVEIDLAGEVIVDEQSERVTDTRLAITIPHVATGREGITIG